GEYYEQGYESGVPESLMRSAAVLTVLDKPPEYLAFRPAYLGKNKELLYVKDMDISILPELNVIPSTPTYDMGSFYFRAIQLWKSYIPRIPASQSSICISRAADNFPSGGHDNGALAETLHNLAALVLMNNTQMINSRGYPSDWKRNISMNLIQFGIDMYGARLANFSSGYTGGQIGHGDKWPILLAGLAFDHDGMKRVGEDFGASEDPRKNNLYFMEDAQIFYVSQNDIDYWNDSRYVVTRTNCRVDTSDSRTIIDDDEGSWFISDAGTDIPARDARTNFDYWLIWDYGNENEEMVRIDESTTIKDTTMKLKTPLTSSSGKTARVVLFPQNRLNLPDWGERHPCNPAGDYYSRSYRFDTGEELVGPQLAALTTVTRDRTGTGRTLWKWNPY
ncbi:MAG: hypothetical protein MUF37_06665, partial [Methanoregulaceae archaeon]|nr:hypothetical protein [Methanoregulaceae archaeon]